MTPMRTSHICTPHHFLPIDTCSASRNTPTCGCIANVLCLAQTACFSSLTIKLFTLAPEHLLLRFVCVISSLICPPLSLPCMCLHSSLCASYVLYMTLCCGVDSVHTIVCRCSHDFIYCPQFFRHSANTSPATDTSPKRCA